MLIFQLNNSYADSPKIYSWFECVDEYWHVITYEVIGEEPYSKIIKDIKTNKKCSNDENVLTGLLLDDLEKLESTLECRKGTWYIVTYNVSDAVWEDTGNPPKEVSAIDTGEPCDVADPSVHITGTIGKVFLVKQVCVNKQWHVVTLDFTNPSQPIKISDVNTNQDCDSTTAQGENKIITELECINEYYYLHDYIIYPDGLKKSIGNLKTTGVKCVEPPFRPDLMSLEIGMTDTHDPTFDPNDGSVSIPGWIKSNADWWSQGLISDREFAAGLGFMVQSGIIQVDDVVVDSEGSIAISDNLSIPTWIRTNAGWWASSAISDDDFKSGIQYMIKEQIISFKERPQLIVSTSKAFVAPNVSPENTQLIFETATQNVVSMTYLQKIKSAEHEMIKNSYDVSINDYSKKKDQASMNIMINLGNAEKIAKNNSDLALQIQKRAVQLAEEAKSAAITSGLNAWDLEAAVVDQQLEIDSMNSNFKTDSEIKSAYNNAQQSQRRAENGLQNIMSSAISSSSYFQQLPTQKQNSIFSEVANTGYSDFVLVPNPCYFQSNSINLFANFLLGLTLPNAYGQQSDDPCPKDTSPKNNKSEYHVYYFGNFIAFDSNGNYLDPGTAPSLSQEFLDFIEATQQPDNGIESVIPELGGSIVGAGFGLFLDPEIVEGYDLLDEQVNLKTGQTEGYSSTDRCGMCGEFGFDPNSPRCKYCGDEFAPYVKDNTCSLCEGEIGDDDVCPDCGTNWGWGPEMEVVTDPDGTEITTFPDGTIITTFPDGAKTTTFPDGAKTTTFPDGTKTATYPDGSETATYPDGSETARYPDGTYTVTGPDGTRLTTLYPDGTYTITSPDGTKTTTSPDGTKIATSPDGTKATTYPNGTITITFPD